MATTERLLVKEAFGDHAAGDRITDRQEIKEVLQTHPEYVLRERVPAEPGKAPRRKRAVRAADADAEAAVEVTSHTLNG